MAKVAIVTDSTAYLPQDMIKDYAVIVLPLQLLWGNDSYRDGIDIQPAEFYARLKTDKEFPTTSQPAPEIFKSAFRHLLDEGYDVLSIQISSKLSGTLDSATQARTQLGTDRIEVFDSLTSGMAMGFQVMAAARLADQGATLAECKAIAEKARAQSGVFFVPSTLEYLRRGGRLGNAAALLGTVLNLKPILEVREGRIEACEKVRTMSKAIDRMLDLFEERLSLYHSPIHIAAHYTDVPDAAQLLVDRARQRFGTQEVTEARVVPVSPVIGVHFGPGGIGLAFMAGL
jgi:DegV family protein with EDD domain